MRLPAGFHAVAWREHFRSGDYVYMVRGTGESGWWHGCTGVDYGGNPMDFQHESKEFKCRTCGHTLHRDEAKRLLSGENTK